MHEWLSLPQLASEHGAKVDQVIGYVHVLMALLFVGWGAFFVYTLIRFRASANPKADYVGVTGHKNTYLEVAVALVEAVILVGFSIPLWSVRVDKFPAEKDAVVVRVVAEQFAWNFHYPGADGVFGHTDPRFVDAQTNPLGLDPEDAHGKDDITTVNQLHLPAHKPVIVRLSSKDVIHSFALWEMRVKQDAIPGIESPLWFEPTVTTEEMRARTGDPKFTYEIGCAQLCGLGHYRMRGFVTIHTQAEFDQWLAAQAPKPGEGGDEFWG
ncbi:MAG: cytochrome c oxidase subunit II [bacterium]